MHLRMAVHSCTHEGVSWCVTTLRKSFRILRDPAGCGSRRQNRSSLLPHTTFRYGISVYFPDNHISVEPGVVDGVVVEDPGTSPCCCRMPSHRCARMAPRPPERQQVIATCPPRPQLSHLRLAFFKQPLDMCPSSPHAPHFRARGHHERGSCTSAPHTGQGVFRRSSPCIWGMKDMDIFTSCASLARSTSTSSGIRDSSNGTSAG